MTDSKTALAAVQKWIDALNCQGLGESVPNAIAVDAIVHRYLPTAKAPNAVFSGHDIIKDWAQRTPPALTFSLIDNSFVDRGELFEVRYQVAALGWTNRGTWRMRLADDGRIAEIHHQPDPLPENPKEEVPTPDSEMP